MKNSQFIIFIIIFSIFFVFFGSSALIILNYNTKQKIEENMVNISAVKDLESVSDLTKAGSGKRYYQGTSSLQKKKETPAIQLLQPGIQEVTRKIPDVSTYRFGEVSVGQVQNPVSDIENVTNRQGYEKLEPFNVSDLQSTSLDTPYVYNKLSGKKKVNLTNVQNASTNGPAFGKFSSISDVQPDQTEADFTGNMVVEGFDGIGTYSVVDNANFENTIPNPNMDKEIQKRNMHKNLVKLAQPIPGDDMKYTEPDKVYNNPFFPDDPSKGTAQNLTPTQHYPNPKDMNSVERNAFKFGYPNYMTMQDYINWLFMFKATPNLLNLPHMINFQKLVNGEPVQYLKDVTPPPAKRLTPLNAEDYYLQMYTQFPRRRTPHLTQFINQDVKVASNLGNSGIMGYNYDEYGNFSQNFDIYGNSGDILNPLLGDKTDPFFLQNIVGPNWERKGQTIPQVTS